MKKWLNIQLSFCEAYRSRHFFHLFHEILKVLHIYPWLSQWTLKLQRKQQLVEHTIHRTLIVVSGQVILEPQTFLV